MSANIASPRIQAPDGTMLAATLFSPAGESRGVVVINSAMATSRRFYRHFAAALAAAGYTTITWDYSGIGDSAPDKLRGYPGSMRDWGLRDIPAVVEWAQRTFSPQSLFLV